MILPATGQSPEDGKGGTGAKQYGVRSGATLVVRVCTGVVQGAGGCLRP